MAPAAVDARRNPTWKLTGEQKVSAENGIAKTPWGTHFERPVPNQFRVPEGVRDVADK